MSSATSNIYLFPKNITSVSSKLCFYIPAFLDWEPYDGNVNKLSHFSHYFDKTNLPQSVDVFWELEKTGTIGENGTSHSTF